MGVVIIPRIPLEPWPKWVSKKHPGPKPEEGFGDAPDKKLADRLLDTDP